MGVSIYLTSSEDNFRYGATTDENGNFEVDIKSGDDSNLVTFSYMGFKSEKIKASNLSNATVKLLEDSEQLDEIIIIGTSPKKDETPASIPTPTPASIKSESKLNVFFNKYGIAIASVSVLSLGFLSYKIYLLKK
jgi:hypothetical protein